MVIKSVTLKVDGLTIAGQLYLPEGQIPFPIICICHGIPARIPDSRESGYTLLAERVYSEGFAVFIFSFRGTGASGGNFDISGWTRDLKAAIDYLCALPGAGHLSLLGFSGGAAVSIYVGSRDERVSSIVSCACPAEFTWFTNVDDGRSIIEHFRSIGIIRDKDFPSSVEEWLNSFRLINPIDHVGGVAPRPLLLVHGNKDEVVDISQAYRLYDRSGEPRELVIVDGAGHRLRQSDEAMTGVISWLKSQLQC